MFSLLHTIVPAQRSGSQSGATCKKTTNSRPAASVLFNKAKHRLMDVNNWAAICNDKSAQFILTDNNGFEIDTIEPEIGNLIKIKLPVLQNKDGNGYDWVRIEKIESQKDFLKDEELYGFRVRPVQDPKLNTDASTHFYTSDASSTFLILRKSTTVVAMECGRNEIPNVNGSIFNKLRNVLVAITAMLGLAKPQWKNLVDGILKSSITN